MWDLRFRLRVSGFVHPAKARVRRLVPGHQPGQLLAAVQGNNEVGSGFQESQLISTLWARLGSGAWKAELGRWPCGAAPLHRSLQARRPRCLCV